MADEYGIQMYDNDGNILDTNLDSALVVEGTIILGNDPIGRLALDLLFPLRDKFKGIFIMPIFHSFCINSGTEHASTVYFDQSSLCWNISYDARSGVNRNLAHHGGCTTNRG